MIELVLEVIWITGVSLGLLCLFLWLTVRTVDGRWVETTGLIVDVQGRRGVRWMTETGRLYSQALHAHDVPDGESMTVYYRANEPERMRLHPTSEAERIFRLLALVLGGVGVVCLIASTVLMLVG